ncbi:hypothetical protein Mapa_005471 [Marchantia paleacea]|nr:hypothetical protein Mapa_005471 [Marchantia paleacea]
MFTDFMTGPHKRFWIGEPQYVTPSSFPCRSMSIVHTVDPRNTEYILRTNSSNFVMGRNTTESLQAFLGHGLLNSEHSDRLYQFQRNIVRVLLGSASSRKHVTSFVACAIEEKLIPYIQVMSVEGKAMDLQDTVMRFTFDCMVHTTFGENWNSLGNHVDCPDAPAQAFYECFQQAADIATQRLYGPSILYKLKRMLNIGSERKLKQVMQCMDKLVTELIQRRRKDLELDIGKDRIDLLTQLLQLQDGQGLLSDTLLKDLLINLMWAGSHTQALTVCWLLWLITLHPEVEAIILEEINAVNETTFANYSGQGDCTSGENYSPHPLAQLSKMQYLHAAVNETLRLYPSVPWNARVPSQDDVLPDGTAVYKGQVVCLNAYSMGRTPGIWTTDCLEFRPERWLRSGQFQPDSPFKFPAFGAGSRICLGRELAFSQIKAVAATLLTRFTFRPVPGHQVCTRVHVLMTMAHGLCVTAHPRCSSNFSKAA